MKTQSIFIAQPQTDEQEDALKAFMQALKIKFEVTKDDRYNREFVEKLLESRQQALDGKVTRVPKQDLTEFLGL